MPYVSRQQEKWAHTAAGEKALGGPAKVHEWDEASKGMKLPKKVKKKNKRFNELHEYLGK
jgi:hypothetical protein